MNYKIVEKCKTALENRLNGKIDVNEKIFWMNELNAFNQKIENLEKDAETIINSLKNIDQ